MVARLVVLAVRMEPAEAAKVYNQTAHTLIDLLTKETDPVTRRAQALVLTSVALGLPLDAPKRSQHATLLATGAFSTPHTALASLPLLHPHFQPQPRPLPPQDLVELLKHPFCVGEARRAVLDALEFTYKRNFRDQWEFVYAQKHLPQLDLLTPPERPQQP